MTSISFMQSYFTPPPSSSSQILVENYQNVMSFSVSLIAGVNLLLFHYYHNENVDYLPWFLGVAGFHCFTDLFLTTKPDIIFHHLCVLGMISYKYMYSVQNIYDAPILYLLYTTELTTIFWVMSMWMKTFSDLRGIVNVLFVISYLKFRVIDYTALILNPIVYNNLVPYTSTSIWSYLHLYGSLYGLYLLNLYWFSIIIKILYKSFGHFFPRMDSDIVCRKVVSFAYISSLLYAIYTYAQYPSTQIQYFYDVFGIMCLCIASYNYHNTVYEARILGDITEDQLDYTDDTVMEPFLIDVAVIHIRCALCALANFYSYEKEVIVPMILFTVGHHTLSYYHLAYAVISAKIRGEPFDETEYGKVAVFTYTSIFITTIMLAVHCDRYLTTIELLIPLIATGMVTHIKPLYKNNHILTHFCLLFQTMTLVRSNLVSNGDM